MLPASSLLRFERAVFSNASRFLCSRNHYSSNEEVGRRFSRSSMYAERYAGRHAQVREARIYQSVSDITANYRLGSSKRHPEITGSTHPSSTDAAASQHAVGIKSTSAAGIDEDLIRRSLDHVNNFAKRHTEKLPQVLMYEINASGESRYKSITLRSLLQFVNDTIPDLDLFNNATQHYPATTEEGGEPNPAYTTPESNLEEEHTVIGELRLRDLRRLDFLFNPNEERAVLIRRHAVLFAIDPIRAVVMSDRVILIVPEGADSLLAILDRYMKEWVIAKHTMEELSPTDQAAASADFNTVTVKGSGSGRINSTGTGILEEIDPRQLDAAAGAAPAEPDHTQQIQMLRKAISAAHELPFEVHAYEALLTTVMVLETQEFNRVNAQVQVILGYFRTGSLLPIEVQEEMRNRKNDLSMMLGRISSARNTIHQLTEDDEDMALMNLTLLQRKPTLYYLPLVPAILTKHDEIEELLESYLIDFNALESKIEYVRSQIQNAEELLSLRLDISRNELLVANSVLALAACCFGLGAYISGIFGMNLDNTVTIQETPHLFYTVIGASTGVMMLVFAGMIALFKRNGTFPKRLKIVNKDMFRFKHHQHHSGDK